MATALLTLIPALLNMLGRGKVGGRPVRLSDGSKPRKRGRGLVGSGPVGGKRQRRQRRGRGLVGSGKRNKWLDFLRDYHSEHPELSYGDAMKKAGVEYRRLKAARKVARVSRRS